MTLTEEGPGTGFPVICDGDSALLQGIGRYVDDLGAERLLYMWVVRSFVPRALTRLIDFSDALALDGLVGGFVSDDSKERLPNSGFLRLLAWKYFKPSFL